DGDPGRDPGSRPGGTAGGHLEPLLLLLVCADARVGVGGAGRRRAGGRLDRSAAQPRGGTVADRHLAAPSGVGQAKPAVPLRTGAPSPVGQRYGCPAAFFRAASTSSQTLPQAARSSSGSFASASLSRTPARSASVCQRRNICCACARALGSSLAACL